MNEPNSITGDRLKGKPRKFLIGPGPAKDEFITLRAQGMSYDQIAGKLGVSRQCLQNWSRELRADLENAKAFHLDGIKAKYQLLQAHRLEQFSKILERLRDELAKRDFAEIPTDRLIALFIKFTKESRNEIIEPQFVDPVDSFDFANINSMDIFTHRPMP